MCPPRLRCCATSSRRCCRTCRWPRCWSRSTPRTGFTGQLAHAGGEVTRSPELTRNLLYVLIAEATNLALTEMAASAGVSYDALAWTAEWYFRPETLAAANAAIVNYHQRLPFAQIF